MTLDQGGRPRGLEPVEDGRDPVFLEASLETSQLMFSLKSNI